MNIHILFPIGTFYPAQSGGPSNSVYWLAKALVQQGLTVTIMTTSTDQPANSLLDQWLDTDTGRVRYISTKNHRWPLEVIRQTLRVLSTVDIIHLTSIFYPLSIVVGLTAIARRKRLIWSPHGELADAALAWRTQTKYLVIKLLKQLSQRITFHTTSPQETAQVRQHFGNVAIIEVPNCLYLSPTTAINVTPKPYLLFLGRLHPIKAIDRLIEAIARSACFRLGLWQLRIVGPDTDGYGDQLKRMVKRLNLTDLVSFEPPVADDVKEALLADAYALILPSHSENFGNVVIEALAHGTPVIASTGTPWQVLEHKQAGFWTDNQVGPLQSAIDTCLSLPPDQYIKYRQSAYTLVKTQFNMQTTVASWLQAYERVMKTAPVS